MAHHDRPVFIVIAATGISALVVQLLIMRECIAQFSGNEFVITLILFTWLLLGSVGNRLAHLVHRRGIPATKNRLAWISLFLAAAPVFQIYAIRWLRDIFFIHGSQAGFYSTLFFILLVMAPYGLAVGMALPYSLFALSNQPEYPGTRAYLADNLGNVVGGILFTFALVFLPGPFLSIFITSLLLICAAYLLFYATSHPIPSWVIRSATVAVLMVLVLGSFLEKPSLAPGEGKLAYYKESPYGRITIFQDRELYTVFSDGNPAFSTGDVIGAEETVHYPLSQIDAPRRILFISAQAGMMAEIEKYAPRDVDYVELNPDLADALFKFNFIHEQKKGTTTVIYEDARRYLTRTHALYDAVIVNLTDPTTFQVNRFFTDRFFSLAKSHLTPGGIFSFSVPGYENYLAEPIRQKLSSLYNTASDHFAHVVLIPGNRVFFLCRDLPVDTDIVGRLDKKKIPTQYISQYYAGNITEDRIKELSRLLDTSTPKNKDLFPHLIRLMMEEWFAVHQTSPKGFIIGATVLLFVYLFRSRKTEFVLFSTGFVTMGSEILTIFAVQIFFGYIYSQIGLIVTFFMAGLLPGAWLGSKWKGDKKMLLRLVDILLIALLIAFNLAAGSEKSAPSLMFFLVFGILISVGCGCQFPLSLHLMKNNDSGAVRSFSADLMGAAFGVLLTSVWFIPFFGIMGAARGLIVIKCLSLIPGLRFRRKLKQ